MVNIAIQLGQTLQFRTTHEEFPQETCPMVLYHRGDGKLVDGQIAVRMPAQSSVQKHEQLMMLPKHQPPPCK